MTCMAEGGLQVQMMTARDSGALSTADALSGFHCKDYRPLGTSWRNHRYVRQQLFARLRFFSYRLTSCSCVTFFLKKIN